MNETQTYKNLIMAPKDNAPKVLIIHHSGGTNTNPLEDTSHHTAQIMESYHLSLGWEGLGYHYVIHKNGDVWKGRPEGYHGAHTTGMNTSSIGICLAGNFDATLPSKEQENALITLLLELTKKYSITPENIVPHRNYAKKTCYGNKLTDDWARNLIKVIPTPEIDMVKIPKALATELKKWL